MAGGFKYEVQRGITMDETPLQASCIPNRLRGRFFTLSSIILISSSVMVPIKRFLGTYLRSNQQPSKVGCAVQRVINLGVPAELFAVVVSQGVDSDLKGVEHADDCGPNQIGCFV